MVIRKKSPVVLDGAAVSTRERAASAFDNRHYTRFGAESQGAPSLADLLEDSRSAEVRWRDCLRAGDRAGAEHWRRLMLNIQAAAWEMRARP